MTVPSYIHLHRSGELEKKAKEALEALSACRLCGRRCGVNRLEEWGKAGCRTGRFAKVASFGPHNGEESPIRGRRGSGTIFFAACNMACVYCQNWELSRMDRGVETKPGELAEMMLALQEMGCHNINLVSPTHVLPQVLEALVPAVERGLKLPLVWNTGGYDSLEALALLDGVVDIYMPDAKYGDSQIALELSGVGDYVEVNRAALLEMRRQAGDLETDEEGVARRGLLVRHLVLPGGLSGSKEVLRFLAGSVSPRMAVNVMDQYHPAFEASKYPPLDRRPTPGEIKEVLEEARRLGLRLVDEPPPSSRNKPPVSPK